MRSMICSHDSMLNRVRAIADFQFGSGTGDQIFPDACEFTLSRTGRIRQILLNNLRIATVRAEDGRLTLSFNGAIRLHRYLPPPGYRVVVIDGVAEFISEGKNAFAKHVIAADPGIRADDEVMVVTADDTLIATGTAALSGSEMLVFNYGAAVNVRHGRT